MINEDVELKNNNKYLYVLKVTLVLVDTDLFKFRRKIKYNYSL